MKLSLTSLLKEITQKQRVERSTLSKLKELSRIPNTYIHFTNLPNKIGFNPRLHNYTRRNPPGYYGFPLAYWLEQFMRTKYIYHDTERYIVVFKPKENLNLFHIKKSDEKYDSPFFENNGPTNALALIKAGYDGVLNDDAADMGKEITIFKPSNVDVLLVAPNSIVPEENKEFYKTRLKNAKMDDQDPEVIKARMKRNEFDARMARKKNPL